VVSEWKLCEEKNVGKRNRTTALDQAIKEVQANYTAKKDAGYFEDVADINNHDKFKPMLAEEYTDGIDFENKKVYSQPKLDGIRCIARSDGLWTRTGKQIVSCPHIWESIKHIFDANPNYTLDGELYNHDLKDDFNEITSIVRKTKPSKEDIIAASEIIQYHVYDIKDSMRPDLLFYQRKEILNRMSNALVLVETIRVLDQTHCNELYEHYLELGYEGQMIRFDESYEHKRSKFLLKRKEFITFELYENEIVAMLEGKGNWSNATKHYLLRKDGKEFKSGVRGKRPELIKLWKSQKKPDWITLRCFAKFTPDGIPRFPVVIDWGYGVRED
jgi:ATP-dependent DNA ligase